MGSSSKQEVYQNFLEFYREAPSSGTASPCTGEEQVRLGRHFLNSVPSSGHRFQLLDFYRLAQEFVVGQHLGRDGFRGLSKAFELLEMLAVNLYLWPWRKEIRSIKTFTGAFVYFIQPVFAPSVLQDILQKLGYVRQGASEYVILKQVNEEEIGQLGFEFFLARAECELMQEMLNEATHRSCEDIVQLRCTSPPREADCMNLQNTGSRLGEGAVVGNNWSSETDLPSRKDPVQSEFSDTPLPLMENNTGRIFGGASEASNDPLGSSRAPIPDNIDLYSDYNDENVRGHISPLYPEQCSSMLALEQPLLGNTSFKAVGNLSPGQTGPLSLSFYSSSFLIDRQPDGKPPGNQGSDVLSQRDPQKSEAAKEECSESWRHGRSTQSKAPQYNNWKKDHNTVVEIELKNMDSSKLPYSTAETTNGALFHQGGHFSASESQEPLGFRGQCRTQLPSACHVLRPSECCLCPSTAFPAGRHPLGNHGFRDSPAQGGSVVREPPQSHYIPPGSPGDRPVPAASACRVCCSPLATAQPIHEECLHVREVAAGGDSDSYLYVSRVACGRADMCRRCQKASRDPAPSDDDLESLQAGQIR
ncbi:uncharacterized protein si:ch211-189a15.5 isoform X2 [Hypanus sabinus]|uniref:uncharacterized protein si:ch211-189a15.5 isoform X2 n=1 Tax=Hypanus sabinus TaxID=79690 RepID=UPI0028C4BD8B|nr:uncharacterized protein si:ch211-189a15.5 isoform X2 [Hypanus sabinus]